MQSRTVRKLKSVRAATAEIRIQLAAECVGRTTGTYSLDVTIDRLDSSKELQLSLRHATLDEARYTFTRWVFYVLDEQMGSAFDDVARQHTAQVEGYSDGE